MVIGVLLRWGLLLELFGLVGLPLSMTLLRHLPERGVCFRRPIGLLLTGYLLWLLATTGWLRNTTAAAVLALCLAALISVAVAWRDRTALLRHLSGLRRVVALESALFFAALLLFGIFRAFNPDIVATEKPMEFAFLNGILQSETFPPHDPWLAGYSISYYYFGYLMAAMLTRLSALPSSVTFNLVGISLFALTISGAFGVVYNLVTAAGQRAARYGLLGGILVAVMGNLVGVLELIRARGWGSGAFWSWLDVRNLQASEPSPHWYPTDNWWWWRASRVIHDRGPTGADQEVISEFPFFSFLLGDNHPHVLALPFVLLAIALALNILMRERVCGEAPAVGTGLRRWMASVARSWPGTPQEVAWWGLILGALAFLNTWDYPIYLLLFGAALAVWRYRVDIGKQGWLRDTAILMLAVGASGVLAYFPFFLSLRSQAGGIGLVSPETKTAPQQFLLMFGIQFSLLPATLTVIAAEMRAALKSVAPPSLAWIWAAAFGLALVASLVAGWWTAALCLLFLLVSGGLLLWGTVVGVRESAGGPDAPTLMVLLMIMVAMGLLCAVEVVYLRDVFDSRMNTVFKFYYQAWVLLSLCGSYGVYRLVRKAGELRRPWQAAVALWLALSGMLVIGGLSYTAAATATKAGLFRGEATLNGTAYVARQRPAEYAAIAWLLADAAPDAVIVEGSGGSYTVENWVSAHTGLQSLLGWAGHERQWRGSGDLPAEREQVLRAIYSGVDMAETDRLLRDYGVDYVLVGPYEREAYDAGDDTLAKLDGLMVRAYQNEVYVIYARAR